MRTTKSREALPAVDLAAASEATAWQTGSEQLSAVEIKGGRKKQGAFRSLRNFYQSQALTIMLGQCIQSLRAGSPDGSLATEVNIKEIRSIGSFPGLGIGIHCVELTCINILCS